MAEPVVTSVSSIDENLEQMIRNLASAEASVAGGRRLWVQYGSLDRSGIEFQYAQATADANRPGTSGDLVTLSNQHDLLIVAARSLNARIATPDSFRQRRISDAAIKSSPGVSGYYRVLETIRTMTAQARPS